MLQHEIIKVDANGKAIYRDHILRKTLHASTQLKLIDLIQSPTIDFKMNGPDKLKSYNIELSWLQIELAFITKKIDDLKV